MPEELDDDRFKKEVMNLLGNLINKSNAHDVRFDSIDERLDSLGQKVDLVSGQFRDLESMSIKDHQLIDRLEDRVDHMEAEAH